MKKAWVGVDIGGTKIALAIVDENGEILAEDKIATEVEKGPDPAVEKMIEGIRKLIEKEDWEIQAIGVGSPGPLDAKRGRILKPSNLHSWVDYPIVEKLEKALGIHTVLGNDADLAGLAEFRFSLKGDHENVAYVTVSTGVGGGIISNGRLHAGSSSCAGEFGHMIVQKNGPLCGCGRHGCLEAFSSGTGIANRMIDKVLEHPDHQLYSKAESKELKAKDVFEAYDKGDELAQAVIEQAEDYLAISLANVINLLNPTVLVMGGGVALGQPRFIKAVQEKIADYAIVQNMETVSLVLAKFQEKAGVIGAAALAIMDER
ncbi:MAG TPA: ROK family protein [Bacillales bacterium]|nr:ROK family protein [Bacillales bacterium]